MSMHNKGLCPILAVKYLQCQDKDNSSTTDQYSLPLTTFVRSEHGSLHDQDYADSYTPAIKSLTDLKDYTPLTPFTANVNDYHVLREMCKGGSSTIYLGLHIPSKKEVIIKIQSKRTRPRSAVTNEVLICAQLSHPSLMTLLATMELPDKYVMVCEHIGNQDLLELIRGGFHFSKTTALLYMYQLASGLHYLHAKNIVHRDIKPDNCVLDRAANTMKLIDFGTSQCLDLGEPQGLVGSIPYMAPELVKDLSDQHIIHKPSLSDIDWKAVDIWALSLVCLLLCTGRIPWSRACATTNREYSRFLSQGPIQPIWMGTPPDLLPLFVAMLHVDPFCRPGIGLVKNTLQKYVV